jgi:hypothetical protein
LDTLRGSGYKLRMPDPEPGGDDELDDDLDDEV